MAEGVIFIDTGAFCGRYRTSDQWHPVARLGWQTLEQRGVSCVTSSLVLAESANLLCRISRAFSFGRHFEIAGFELWPTREGE